MKVGWEGVGGGGQVDKNEVYHQVVKRISQEHGARDWCRGEEERKQWAMKIPQFGFVWSVGTVTSE